MQIYPYTIFFFFNDTATTEIYTLSLHDALPICARGQRGPYQAPVSIFDDGIQVGPLERIASREHEKRHAHGGDRKSTRLNSSHGYISYAVFCLKKKKKNTDDINDRAIVWQLTNF